MRPAAYSKILLKRTKLLTLFLVATLALATTFYIDSTLPRPIRAGQVNLNSGTEPRSLSDIINFTQKANLAEAQIPTSTSNWEQTLRTINRNLGTSQVYKEGCIKYNCSGGLPVPRDVEIAPPIANNPLNVDCSGGPGICGPDGVAVNPTTNRVYVTDQNSAALTVIDGNTNSILTTISGVGSNPIGVAVNPTTNRVYVAAFSSNNVTVIDGASNTILAKITVGTNPIGLAINPSTNRIYVTNENSNSVSVIDGASNTVLTSVAVGALPLFPAVNPSANLVYVPNFNGNTVSVINATTNSILPAITVASGPVSVAVNPITNRIFAAIAGGGGCCSMYVINGATNTVLTSFALAQTPNGVAVNTNTNHVYVTNPNVNSVTVIDGGTNSIISTFTVGTDTRLVAVNPSTGRVYATNRAEDSVSVIGQREEIREACLQASSNCLLVSSTGTLFPGTAQATAASLIAVSLRSNTTKTGTQMAITVACDNNALNFTRQCFALYVDGNVWGAGQLDLTKSPFIIQNAEPYFYLQWHWWDFNSARIVAWSYWWYGSQDHCNWYWGVYWWWRTYVNYYIGIWLPWWWWVWHWTYWRYWNWWSTCFST